MQIPPFGQRPRNDVVLECSLLGNNRIVSTASKYDRHGVFIGQSAYLRKYFQERKSSATRRKPGDRDAWQLLLDRIEPHIDRHVDGRSSLYQVRYDVCLYPHKNGFLTPRGGVVFGCEDTVLRYIAYCILAAKIVPTNQDVYMAHNTDVCFDAKLEGVYAVTYAPVDGRPLHIIPYFDIDVKVPLNVDSELALKKLYLDYLSGLECIMEDLIEKYVDSTEHARAKQKQWFCCVREMNGKLKISLHVHWYNLVVEDMAVMSNIAVNHMSEIKYPVYDPDLECFDDGVEVKGSQMQDTLIDQGVYSTTTQLFRFPFTGKMRQSLNAHLLPISMEMDGDDVIITRGNQFTHESVFLYLKRASICTLHKSGYVNLSIGECEFKSDHEVIVRPRTVPNQRSVHTTLIDTDDEVRLLEFWAPILQYKVIPEFANLRRKHASRMNLTTVVIPDQFDVSTLYQTGLDYLPGCWTLEVDDTFCVYDTRTSTPHRHPLKEGVQHCVTYVIDLMRLRIAQACKRSACTHNHKLEWFSFVHPTSHVFRVDKAPFSMANLQFFEPSGDQELRYDIGCQICIWHNIDSICYDELTNTFYVYLYDGVDDTLPRIWNESSVLLQDRVRAMVSELNEKYLAYMSVFINISVKEQIRKFRQTNPNVSEEMVENRRRAEHMKAVNVFKKRAQMILSVKKEKIKENMILLLSNKTALKKSNIFTGMEVYPHLVPMRNHMCYNIFTGEQQKIRPEHRFTSYINAHFDLKDEYMDAYDKWQLEMCSEDFEYAYYKKCIIGITLSGRFERRVYVAIGQGRNGKSVEQSLLSELLNYKGFKRGINLNKNYLTSSGQSNSSANAPDPTVLAIKYRVCVSIDELSERKLDGALLKTVCSGGRMSGRGLYEKTEQEIDVRTSMWIVCNEVPQVDYTQTAIVDRMVFIPYRTRWLGGHEYDLEMKSAGDKRMLKRADESFQQFVRDNMRNACFTSCMASLTAYYKKNEIKDSSSFLADIKKPSVVLKQCLDYQYLHHPLKEFFERWLVRKPSAWLVTDCVTLSVAFSAYSVFCAQNNKKWVKNYKVDSTKFEDMLPDVKAEKRVYCDVIYIHPFVLHPSRVDSILQLGSNGGSSYYEPTAKRSCIARVSADANVL